MKKCKKCDRDGYIKLNKYSRKSCACGYAIAKQREALAGMPLKTLLEYAVTRMIEKRRMANVMKYGKCKVRRLR